ncbi:exonuclease SbcCD subunit D [Jatrophihabitans sp.]|uniref:exonuclease SbcCD subunit D n=1 Tax=Jatrophihabitans sp. TaxID=1932789 RepID=UPI002D061513|nr:exonuclease SbcCD subunit D [Jatrophihabitans sp.]
MKFLHTSDWHVGKTLKNRSRHAEQAAVLAEIIDIARDQEVDAVLIAGDLYETAGPSAEAQTLLVQALMALRATGAEVIAIAGNHDHGTTFEAYRPLMRVAGIQLLGQARRVDDGGMVTFTARSTGERVNVAVLPFLSQRYAIKAMQLLSATPAQNAGRYDQQLRDIIDHLKTGFTPGAVNLVMAHLTVTGAAFGGGERQAQSIFEYSVPATVFGAEPHYVALGHLHRRQSLPAPCPVHYCGAPIAVDFGEQDNTSMVLLVEVSPTTPAEVTEIPLTRGRRLRTVYGTFAQLLARADEFGEDYLRVYVSEPGRAGLVEELRTALPNALEIRIDPKFVAATTRSSSAGRMEQQTPQELFDAYCAERTVDDEKVRALFARLHDEVTSADGPGRRPAATASATSRGPGRPRKRQ